MPPTHINAVTRERDNTAAQAFNLKFSPTVRYLKGKIGGSDQIDYLRFKIGQRSSINLLSQHQYPVNIELLDSQKQLIQSVNHQKKSVLEAVLNPGTYLVRLATSDRRIQNYRLGFSASPNPALSQLPQYYTFKYSYGNGDYYTGYGYSQAGTYKNGQDLFDAVVNETGFKGEYKITSIQDSINTANVNQVFVNYYYDSERKASCKPASGFGGNGLGSELGYLFPQDKGTYFGGKFYEADMPILLGVSTPDYWGNQSVVENQLNRLGAESGKRLSMGSVFVDIEDSNPGYNIPTQLNNLLNNGYTGFMQLTSHRTLAEILNGSLDGALQRFAQAYAKWATEGENRSAWLAPLPEMNGTWESYSADPQSFKQAYRHIQQIFEASGVPKQSVRWVFAPNGWSPSDRSFESFYPGAEFVDAVAFSAYNWGYAEAAGYKKWQTPLEVFDPYVQRMRSMAPDKPIFITQTGTTSMTATGSNPEAKDQWLQDAYTYFASAPGIRGILYFNLNKETDWSLFDSSGKLYKGYQAALQPSAAFDYVSPAELAQTQLAPNSQS